MIVIVLSDEKNYLRFAHPLHSLFYEYACDCNIQDQPYSNGDGSMFGTPMRLFVRLVEIWALEKFQMKLKFIPKNSKDNAIGMIIIGWDGLSKEECEDVLLNMYPESVAEIQQQND